MMLESTIKLVAFSEGRVERLASGSEPVKNCMLQALCVVHPGTTNTFLQLGANISQKRTSSNRELTRLAKERISSALAVARISENPGIESSRVSYMACSVAALFDHGERLFNGGTMYMLYSHETQFFLRFFSAAY
jgi:hypothetical protein